MIYAYIRVSTGNQDVMTQKSEIMSYIIKTGVVVDQYIEETISSKVKLENRNLYKLLKKLKSGDTILVYELSRLGRSMLEINKIASMIIESGAKLIITSKNTEIGTDINSQVFLFAFGLAAEIERELISDRTKAGLKKAKQEGIKLGRPKGRTSKSKLDDKKKEIQNLLNKKVSKSSICKIYEVTASTLDNFIKTRKLNQ